MKNDIDIKQLEEKYGEFRLSREDFEEALRKCLRLLPGKERPITPPLKRRRNKLPEYQTYWCKKCRELLTEDIVPIGKRILDKDGKYCTYICAECLEKP